MKIDSNGDLLVLDSYFGLYRVNVVTGQKKLLVSSAKGMTEIIHGSHSLYVVLTQITLSHKIFLSELLCGVYYTLSQSS